jgi:Leucine-rich repeat (LRR) protein
MNPLEIHNHVAKSSGRDVGDISPLTAELTALASQAQADTTHIQLPGAVANVQRGLSELAQEQREAVEQRERAMEIAQRHLDDFIEYLQGFDVNEGKLQPLLEARVIYNEDTEEAYIAQQDGETIEKLYLSACSLTGELPLPKELRLAKLDCDDNQLTSLPELPVTLTRLSCSDNQLTSLPDLPDTLETLYCRYNQLTSLPELPATLKKLYCDFNQLTSLPELPVTLTVLDCHANLLSALQKQATLEQFPGATV